jgi:hypothetical protein
MALGLYQAVGLLPKNCMKIFEKDNINNIYV